MQATEGPAGTVLDQMGPAGDEHRHRCEVRQLLRWRVENGIEFARDYLAGVEKRRGPAAARVLREDVLAQWNAGNRGAIGDWREVTP